MGNRKSSKRGSPAGWLCYPALFQAMTAEHETTPEVDDWAFRCIAGAYPHDAYDTDPERFWAYFQTRYPEWTREQMIALLEETRHDAGPEVC